MTTAATPQLTGADPQVTRQPLGTLGFLVRDPDGNLHCFASAA